MAKGIKTGGGSRKGIPNKATAAKAEAIANSGLTPLDYLLSLLRDTDQEPHIRADAAKAAAPYVHPKLANVELTGKDKGPLNVSILRFNDLHPQSVGAAAVSNAGLEEAGGGVSSGGDVLAPSKRKG